jgi:hypothetical protein
MFYSPADYLDELSDREEELRQIYESELDEYDEVLEFDDYAL